MGVNRIICGLLVAWAGTAGVAQTPEMPPPLRPLNLTPTSEPVYPAVEPADEIVEGFVKHVGETASYPETARQFVAAEWAKRRGNPEAETFVVDALAVLYPEFKAALDLQNGNDASKATGALAKLAESDDPYLAVNAAALAAQAMVGEDRLVNADALLRGVEAKHGDWRERTTSAGEMLFLSGFSAVQMLRYEQATAELGEFLHNYANAPERLRKSAEQMIKELNTREPDGLSDVHDLMDYARREMDLGKSGDDVREKQKKAVDLLGKLVEQAEDQEKQQQQQQQQQNSKSQKNGGGKNNNDPRGAKPGAQHAQKSTLPQGGGDTNLGDNKRVRPGESWGKMPAKEREALLQALQKRFPSQYRDLVEQYYRELSKENGEP